MHSRRSCKNIGWQLSAFFIGILFTFFLQNTSLLSEFLGVTKNTLTSSSGIYKGISSLIKNVLADLEGDKSSKTIKNKIMIVVMWISELEEMIADYLGAVEKTMTTFIVIRL